MASVPPSKLGQRVACDRLGSWAVTSEGRRRLPFADLTRGSRSRFSAAEGLGALPTAEATRGPRRGGGAPRPVGSRLCAGHVHTSSTSRASPPVLFPAAPCRCRRRPRGRDSGAAKGPAQLISRGFGIQTRLPARVTSAASGFPACDTRPGGVRRQGLVGCSRDA